MNRSIINSKTVLGFLHTRRYESTLFHCIYNPFKSFKVINELIFPSIKEIRIEYQFAFDWVQAFLIISRSACSSHDTTIRTFQVCSKSTSQDLVSSCDMIFNIDDPWWSQSWNEKRKIKFHFFFIFDVSLKFTEMRKFFKAADNFLKNINSWFIEVNISSKNINSAILLIATELRGQIVRRNLSWISLYVTWTEMEH